ncbi:cation:proton antiporter [Halorarum halophilum]|uniref:Cation:proton antiporter n=1 Tax=Halorarum halophilum TaxID=2743090 RepID=A0A7D5KXU0_9EURY|nr:cation:proton antiporter [Halobaculum halophilum]QLG28738.1 cation:proton antiporter [Halobaculum halophilum]
MVEAAGIDLLGILLVLALALVFGSLAERAGYPAMMGELFAGIVFGPPLLGLLSPSAGLEVLAELGVFLLMVYVGMEVDMHELFALGPKALVVAVGGFLVPFGLGYGIGALLGFDVGASLFVGLAMAATSLATKSRILSDLGLLDTRIAGVLLGGALVSDVGVLVAFAGVLGYADAGSVNAVELGVVLGQALAFFAVAFVVGDRFLPAVWHGVETFRERYGFVTETTAFTVALVVALVFAELAHLAGLHAIIGGFVAGMFIRQADLEPALYDHMEHVVRDLAVGVFAPVFFVTVGFELTLDVFGSALGTLALLVAVAFVGKIVGSWLFSLPTGLTSREGLVVGLGMNGRGTVEIIIASVGLSAGIIDQSLFSMLVFIAIFTTAMVPVTMTWGVRLLDRSGELYGADGSTVALADGGAAGNRDGGGDGER